MGLTEQIRLENYTTTKDAQGHNKSTVTKYNFWAEVEDLGGSKNFRAGQPLLAGTYRFKVRFNPTIHLTARWKVVYRSMRLNISHLSRDRFNWLITAQKIDKH